MMNFTLLYMCNYLFINFEVAIMQEHLEQQRNWGHGRAVTTAVAVPDQFHRSVSALTWSRHAIPCAKTVSSRL